MKSYFKGLLGGAILLGVGLGCSSKSQVGKAEPMTEKASIQYGFCYDAYTQSDLIPALSACLQAEKFSPNSADAKNLLGLIYFRQEEYEKAEQKFKDAVDLDHKLSEGFNNLGTLYLSQKKYDKALVALNEALDNPLYLYPERIHNNLGLVYAGLDKFEDARQHFQHSIKLRPDFFLPYQNLARLYFDHGDFENAKPLLLQVVKLCEDCSESRYQLGKVYLKESKVSEAKKIFQQGSKIDPNGKFGALCSESLKTME